MLAGESSEDVAAPIGGAAYGEMMIYFTVCLYFFVGYTLARLFTEDFFRKDDIFYFPFAIHFLLIFFLWPLVMFVCLVVWLEESF